MDDKIRRLERRAATGDQASCEELWRNKRRSGETVIVPCPECKGRGEVPDFAQSQASNLYGYSSIPAFNPPQNIKCDACEGWGQVRAFLEDIPIYKPTKPASSLGGNGESIF